MLRSQTHTLETGKARLEQAEHDRAPASTVRGLARHDHGPASALVDESAESNFLFGESAVLKLLPCWRPTVAWRMLNGMSRHGHTRRQRGRTEKALLATMHKRRVDRA